MKICGFKSFCRGLDSISFIWTGIKFPSLSTISGTVYSRQAEPFKSKCDFYYFFLFSNGRSRHKLATRC